MTELLSQAWPVFQPGASGRGHDLLSASGRVAAEVFAAVKPSNNDKLNGDTARIRAFPGEKKYVFFRSPREAASESMRDDVVVVSLGPPTSG